MGLEGEAVIVVGVVVEAEREAQEGEGRNHPLAQKCYSHF